MRNKVFGFIVLLLVVGMSSCKDDEGAGSDLLPTCFDGVQNQDEAEIDCGGVCEACTIPESCVDGIQNQDESGVDCGGVCDACSTLCDEPLEGDCDFLSEHIAIADLRQNSCNAYCIMKMFSEECEGANINGIPLTAEEYLDYFYDPSASFNERLGRIGTMVHEAVHANTRSQVPNFSGKMYCHLGCNGGIVIDQTSTFRSQDLVEVIGPTFRTFRFDTYIDSDSEFLGTQQFGVYGLLDEFTAYYQGSRSTFDYQPQFDFQSPGRIYSVITAYYEFKYYILTYMIYAEENHNDMFQAIVSNEEFKQGFNQIHNQYESLVAEYLEAGYSTFSTSETYQYMPNVIGALDSQEYTDMMTTLQ